MREEGPGMIKAAATKVVEVTAVGTSAMTITIAETVKGRTQLAEARGTKSPRTVLRHLPQ